MVANVYLERISGLAVKVLVQSSPQHRTEAPDPNLPWRDTLQSKSSSSFVDRFTDDSYREGLFMDMRKCVEEAE